MAANGEAPLPPEGWSVLKKLVELLVNRDFESIKASGAAARVPVDALEDEMNEHGRSFIPLPDAAWERVEPIQVQDEARWYVDVDLWTVEDGESDLTLSVEVERAGDGTWKAEIQNLHTL